MLENIVLGITASIVASIVISVFNMLVDISAKQKIELLANKLINEIYCLHINIEYGYYDTAIMNADKIIEHIDNILVTIKLFTHNKTQTKWIVTILGDMKEDIWTFKRITYGLTGDSEKTARCERFYRKYCKYLYSEIIEEIEQQGINTRVLSGSDRMDFMANFVLCINRYNNIGKAFYYALEYSTINHNGYKYNNENIFKKSLLWFSSYSIHKEDTKVKDYYTDKRKFNTEDYKKYADKGYKQYIKYKEKMDNKSKTIKN